MLIHRKNLTSRCEISRLPWSWSRFNDDGKRQRPVDDILASKGLSQETISRVTSREWFCEKPTEELWHIWTEFSAATSSSLNPAIDNELIDEIVRLCRLVADASGGFMG